MKGRVEYIEGAEGKLWDGGILLSAIVMIETLLNALVKLIV